MSANSTTTGPPDETTVTVDLAIDVYEYVRDHSTFEDTIGTALRRLLNLPSPFSEARPEDVPHHAEAAERNRAAPAISEGPAPQTPRRRAAAKTKRTRARAGTLLPESEYHRPILEVLEARGGRASKAEVIEEIGLRLDDRLTETDRLPLESGGIRWQSRAQFARLRLIDRGLMEREAPRGIWGISPDGLKALEDGTV
jgi:Mrr restriction endonuclease-like protein